jgi:hypothetical protein
MQLLTAAGLLVLSAGTGLAGYLVSLDGGDRMTVDSYREDGDRIHLIRDDVDLNVPRTRIRSVTEFSAPEKASSRSLRRPRTSFR